MRLIDRILRKLREIKLKGQYTLHAMLMTILSIIAYSQLYPMLKEILDEVIPEMDGTVGTLVALSPLFIFLFILYGALWYVSPHREQ